MLSSTGSSWRRRRARWGRRERRQHEVGYYVIDLQLLYTHYNMIHLVLTASVQEACEWEGNGKWEKGNGKWEKGNGKWEKGNGKWEKGNGKWGKVGREMAEDWHFCCFDAAILSGSACHQTCPKLAFLIGLSMSALVSHPLLPTGSHDQHELLQVSGTHPAITVGSSCISQKGKERAVKASTSLRKHKHTKDNMQSGPNKSSKAPAVCGHTHSTPNYSQWEVNNILNLVEVYLPVGSKGWQAIGVASCKAGVNKELDHKRTTKFLEKNYKLVSIHIQFYVMH
jgi:hypothetical protein